MEKEEGDREEKPERAKKTKSVKENKKRKDPEGGAEDIRCEEGIKRTRTNQEKKVETKRDD